MKRLADDVEQLGGFPPDLVNAYLAGGVLFDTTLRARGRGVLRQLRGRRVEAVALTHGHGDHQASAALVCDRLGVPLWCGAAEADAVASGRIGALLPRNPVAQLVARFGAGPARPVDRRLAEGDEVGGFRVIDAPGHSPGHVAYWREADRTLILGDVLTNINIVTMIPGLHEPPRVFTVDPARNRRSARRLLELGVEPALVCFGHGPPLRDPKRFLDFLRGLRE
jgi:hydroxyacylglutathione hydrolase